MKSSPEQDSWYQVKNAGELASPALLVYPERVDENLRQLVGMVDVGRLRPHVKTHKMAEVVQRQLRLGIRKFKCATLAEAELVAASGAADVLLAMQPVGPAAVRLAWLAAQRPDIEFSTIADAPSTLNALSQAARQFGSTLSIYVDIDCGMHRTGLPADDTALELYQAIGRQEGLRAAGLHVYDGHIRDADRDERERHCTAAFAPVADLAQRLVQTGFSPPAIVAGGSPTLPFHAQRAEVECSPGTVVFWDAGYGSRFSDLPFKPAACVFCRVVSKPGPDRLCLDLGHKAVASENPHPRVEFLNLSGATPVSQSEEHLVVESAAARAVPIGAEIYGIPIHICPTVALYDHAQLIEQGWWTGRWAVAARHRG